MSIVKRCMVLSVICACILSFALCSMAFMSKDVCDGASVLDILSPKVIEFYESEIAHNKVVTNRSEEWLERVADRYNISVQKVKAVLVVQDFCGLCGENKTFAELAKCSDYELFAIVKEHIEEYLNSLDDAQKEELKEKGSDLFLSKQNKNNPHLKCYAFNGILYVL